MGWLNVLCFWLICGSAGIRSPTMRTDAGRGKRCAHMRAMDANRTASKYIAIIAPSISTLSRQSHPSNPTLSRQSQRYPVNANVTPPIPTLPRQSQHYSVNPERCGHSPLKWNEQLQTYRSTLNITRTLYFKRPHGI